MLAFVGTVVLRLASGKVLLRDGDGVLGTHKRERGVQELLGLFEPVVEVSQGRAARQRPLITTWSRLLRMRISASGSRVVVENQDRHPHASMVTA